MPRSFLRLAPAAAGAALAVFTAACGDAPTLPTSFAQEAGGRTWVAVSEPAGMPDARTWASWAAPHAAREVRALVAEAARARRGGELEGALALESRARLLSAASLAEDPPAPRVRAAVAAVREWEARAADRLRAGSYAGLDSALAAVSARRAEAEAALRDGRPREAVALLAEAGEAARAYAPVRVALGLLSRAEARIDGDPSPTPDLRRARLLLRLAREAMATGDEARAMKRAGYALQIIEAHDGGLDARR
jgi:hypothetical protein